MSVTTGQSKSSTEESDESRQSGRATLSNRCDSSSSGLHLRSRHRLTRDRAGRRLVDDGSVRLKDRDGLQDLGGQCVRALEEMEQLAVVHLQKHTGDFPSELGLAVGDERKQALAEHLLLLLGGRGGQGRGCERLSGCWDGHAGQDGVRGQHARRKNDARHGLRIGPVAHVLDVAHSAGAAALPWYARSCDAIGHLPATGGHTLVQRALAWDWRRCSGSNTCRTLQRRSLPALLRNLHRRVGAWDGRVLAWGSAAGWLVLGRAGHAGPDHLLGRVHHPRLALRRRVAGGGRLVVHRTRRVHRGRPSWWRQARANRGNADRGQAALDGQRPGGVVGLLQLCTPHLLALGDGAVDGLP
mmetsp:Transcript_23229/g.39931  ORF Transcript_23229/g.39931 Transcript_23229/m.39931 type:complete len:356 (+) Transcript_23229:155-1222(+)